MLLLTSTSDLIRVVSSAAGALDVHTSWVDNASGTITPGRTNTASISTATTTTVVAAPGASTQRNVRNVAISNESGSVTNVVTVEHFDGTTAETIWKGTLLAGERVIMDDDNLWVPYAANGIQKKDTGAKVFNQSTTQVSASYASDIYMAGSFIVFPNTPKVGTRYKCKFTMTKTAAGTATPIVTVRTGTAGSTADTSRCAFTFGAGTAAAETAEFEVDCYFRAVGTGTNAVLVGTVDCINLSATGVMSTFKSLTVVSSGFDSTTASLGIGFSFNGGASFSGTNNFVFAECENFV